MDDVAIDKMPQSLACSSSSPCNSAKSVVSKFNCRNSYSED